MKKISLIVCCLSVFLTPVFAEETSGSTWVDVTEEVAANPLNKGGWTIDETGKAFRSEDGNQVKIQHSEYGVFIVDLPGEKVDKVVDEKTISQEKSDLLQRDGGMMLVVRADEYKFRVRFSERVSGMHTISGIKGM
jgi:hypothetical protein